jgi:HAD superfamily hydrolase (TIGR01509 family)
VGIDLNESFCHSFIGVPAEVCRRLLLDRYGEDAPADRFFEAASARLLDSIDGGLMQLKPGVVELLDFLRARKVPCAVATSSAKEKANHHLEAAGIDRCFDVIVTRDEVARGKPFPDLYLHAAQRLGAAAECCLALEDSYNGVRAAAAAAMPVVMVPDLLPPTEEMRTLCHAILPDLHEVMEMLAAAGERAKPAP